MYVEIASRPPDCLMPLQYVTTPKNTKEGRCKDVNDRRDYKIVNADPIDKASVICKPEADSRSRMEWHKNVIFTDTKWLESYWTENSSLTKTMTTTKTSSSIWCQNSRTSGADNSAKSPLSNTEYISNRRPFDLNIQHSTTLDRVRANLKEMESTKYWRCMLSGLPKWN